MTKTETILENATIIQKNGIKQICDAILISESGVYTGSINRKKQCTQIFREHSFIPCDQIEKITVYNKQGKPQDIEIEK
jgi:hypothetical protein